MEKPFLSGRTGQIWQAIMLVLGGGMLVVGTLLVIDRHVVQPAFQVLEHQQGVQDNERAYAGIAHQLANLVDLAQDWSNWDDAYAFAQDRNPEFVQSNYPDGANLSKNSGIDLLAFFDLKGDRLLQGIFDPESGQELQLQCLAGEVPPLRAALAPVFDHATPMEGLLETESGLLLLVARPILASDDSGPTRGVLLMGRFLKTTRIKQLAQQVKVAVLLSPRRELPKGEQRLFDRLLATGADTAPTLLGESVYRILLDIERKPLALLQTPVHNDIRALGKRTGVILSSLLSSIALVLLVCLAIYRYRVNVSQDNLAESEARYRELFEAESDAIFLIDNETGQILEANQAAVSLYGYDREALLLLKNVDLSAEPEETRRLTRSASANLDHVVTIPLRAHLKKDGTVFPVEITGRGFVHKGRSVHIAAVRDSTERLRLESRLRFTQFAIDHSADGACWVNSEGRLVYVNEEGCRGLGYTREELEGMTVADIDPSFPLDTWPHHWQQLQREKSILLETTHRRKDGSIFPVEIRANFVAFDGLEYNCAIIRDISERKRLEQERVALEALNRQLQKEESLGRMAGAIAHHFNNQLMVTLGFIELAIDQQQNGERADDELASAMAATERAAKMSAQMLVYLGQTFTARHSMELAEACRQSLPLFQAMLPGNVVLAENLPSPGPMVNLNVEQIQQILTSLVTNSVEGLGDQSGRIELGVKIVPAVDIPAANRFPVGWHPQFDAYACLTVADNGCGIEAEHIEKIFDPFYTSKFVGQGLGLALVLGLTKAHDGVITVKSEPGRGTVVQVFLPCVQAEPVPQSDLGR